MSERRATTATLLAVGDIGPAVQPVDRMAERVLPVLRDADVRFGQCERIYSNRPAAVRSHVNLAPEYASIWNTAGIDVISLASNNAMRMGADILCDTIELFRGMGKQVIGAGPDIAAARTPAIVERNGVTIAFLAYCSVLRKGHEATAATAGCVSMRAHTSYVSGEDPEEEYQPGIPPRIVTVPDEQDLQALCNDIRDARQRADAVVMSIHWGLHHIPKAIAMYQPVIAHAAIDAGADLILGHHAHCLKAVEVYKGKVCFYSIGNFMTSTAGAMQSKQLDRAKWNLWDLWWYRIDDECLPPHGTYHYPPDSRNTMMVKAMFGKGGVERVSFLPTYINPQGQPSIVQADSARFQEILAYMEWNSDQFPHQFRVEGSEVIVEMTL